MHAAADCRTAVSVIIYYSSLMFSFMYSIYCMSQFSVSSQSLGLYPICAVVMNSDLKVSTLRIILCSIRNTYCGTQYLSH